MANHSAFPDALPHPPLLLASNSALPFPCLRKPSTLGLSKPVLCPLQLGAFGFTTLPPPYTTAGSNSKEEQTGTSLS